MLRVSDLPEPGRPRLRMSPRRRSGRPQLDLRRRRAVLWRRDLPDRLGHHRSGGPHLPAGELPPVNASWSLTLYELPASLLHANPLQRYLINSPMLPDLQRNPDGSLTIYVQNVSPGKDKEANWLPAPAGTILTAMRLHWPKQEALDGSWKAPKMERMD
ncbi:DUF1214 domain-containing protein [Rhizobium laguerreae]|nr:DUF1214 domain-containing protein [Rhizobium laguerreae]MBY3363083.1 DUF1214 domain-containing protein [Rhizobium laguerreae]